MHRSAETLVETGGAGENLSHCSVEEEADTLLLYSALEVLVGDIVGGAVPELVHDLLEFSLRKNLDRTHSLGKDFTMGAV